jgi:phosphate transport system substrate-binding protein
MRVWAWAAAIAMMWGGPVRAQDATLTSRDGGLSLAGDLLGFDGEFYRLSTRYGVLTVDAAGVICEGPACPSLTTPLTVIRMAGAAEPGMDLLPGLFRAFARSRGLDYAPAEAGAAGFAATLTNPRDGTVLARIAFVPSPLPEATAALEAGTADLAVSPLPAEGARVLALEALLPIVAADNPVVQVRSTDLLRAFTGEVTNWRDLGGPDMPIVLHALAPEVALQAAVAARIGAGAATGETIVHDSPSALAAAVARDPWALALTGASAVGAARVLPLTDSCDFPLPVTAMTVKAEDYPLAAPLFLVVPPRRLPLLTREFLEFLATDAAQDEVRAAGYVDRRPAREALTGDGRRLLGAIRNAGTEVPLDELQRLAAAMTGAERVSLTFRFRDGSTELDPPSQDALADLARLIGARGFDGYRLVLAGFSDGSGSAAANLDLSRTRADAVRAALTRIAPDLSAAELPEVEAYGEALPMACDTTAIGRQINRRVELWLRPLSDWDGPEDGTGDRSAVEPL